MRTTTAPEKGRTIVADALPPVVASVLEPAQLESIRQRLAQLPDTGPRAGLDAEDWKGALGVLLLVFVSTLPVALPFVFMREAHLALRVSNGIAIAMLFLCGYRVARLTGHSPWGTGLGMVALGAALAAMTMALGG